MIIKLFLSTMLAVSGPIFILSSAAHSQDPTEFADGHILVELGGTPYLFPLGYWAGGRIAQVEQSSAYLHTIIPEFRELNYTDRGSMQTLGILSPYINIRLYVDPDPQTSLQTGWNQITSYEIIQDEDTHSSSVVPNGNLGLFTRYIWTDPLGSSRSRNSEYYLLETEGRVEAFMFCPDSLRNSMLGCYMNTYSNNLIVRTSFFGNYFSHYQELLEFISRILVESRENAVSVVNANGAR